MSNIVSILQNYVKKFLNILVLKRQRKFANTCVSNKNGCTSQSISLLHSFTETIYYQRLHIITTKNTYRISSY